MSPLGSSPITPGNLLLSPATVKFNGIILGATLGNVVVTPETEKSEIKADQMGTSPIDRVVSGQTYKVAFEIAEVKYKDNWRVVFPHFHLVTSGGNKSIYVDSQIGRKDSDDAAELILHPIAFADADLSGNHKFFKAISDGTSEIIYGPGEQARLKCSMFILPDFTVTPARYWIHGDPAIGLVNASAGAPSFVGTGNGAMGSVVAYNGFTRTENIVAKCVTKVTDNGIFYVSGSLSGPLGLATVGVPFVSPQLSFTIADGAIDFELDDEFTVATVGSNWV